MEKERFDVGIGTSLSLTQVRQNLIENSIDEVRSVIGRHIALVNFYLAGDSLPERRGIIVE